MFWVSPRVESPAVLRSGRERTGSFLFFSRKSGSEICHETAGFVGWGWGTTELRDDTYYIRSIIWDTEHGSQDTDQFLERVGRKDVSGIYRLNDVPRCSGLCTFPLAMLARSSFAAHHDKVSSTIRRHIQIVNSPRLFSLFNVVEGRYRNWLLDNSFLVFFLAEGWLCPT